jgi:hypothetical protein
MPYTSFIDSTYFTGEVNIPTLPTSDTSLTQAITQYEKEVLISLLGYKLYSLLVADCTSGVPATQKYIDLVDGKEFDHVFGGETITLKWEGLKNSAKISLISQYVFYKYVERDITRLYGTGVSMAVPAVDNNGHQRVSAVNKLCAAWERMRELYGKIPPEYKPIYTRPILGTNLPSVFNSDPSAYNFLFANKTDYPDWIFTPIWNINAFGI